MKRWHPTKSTSDLNIILFFRVLKNIVHFFKIVPLLLYTEMQNVSTSLANRKSKIIND